MVDWQNPVTIINEFGAFVKLIHVIDGIYIWEFICNLSFEWSLLRRRRQWRWTAAVLSDLVGLNVMGQINCKLWLIFVLVFGYAATSLALSLYALRSVAVWQRSLPITLFSIAIIMTNLGVWIRCVAEAQSQWLTLSQSCSWQGSHRTLLNNILLLGTEVVLIVLMASGIYNHNPGRRAFKIMYREGLLWLLLAAAVQTVPVVFLILDLNEAMNVMFIIPSVICTSIGATRMYRSLSDRQADSTFGKHHAMRRRAKFASGGRPRSSRARTAVTAPKRPPRRRCRWAAWCARSRRRRNSTWSVSSSASRRTRSSGTTTACRCRMPSPVLIWRTTSPRRNG
ncbi:hypothetical protein EDB89DRAFT_1522942 [Lactarius sanguifluus]|nr:hypothetical protein EDB89DRAFT_1522942 [Lactarius sanguifluus]